MTKEAVKVAITGAAGQLAYSLIFRVASGEVFGKDTPVHLHLVEIPPAMRALEGVVMELDDCAYPTLKKIKFGDDPSAMFEGINWALLVGSKPRGPGMERKDLLTENGKIFVNQGRALERAADDVRAFVVGNPANTNCLIAMHNAPSIPRDRFSAMTRLDHNRALTQVAQKAGVDVSQVSHMCVWGNHSATQYPDCYNAKVNGQPAAELINDQNWIETSFLPTVQQRGAAIIKARGVSSAASAANAAIDHVKTILYGTPEGEWTSSSICSDGSYGITPGLIFSFPVEYKNMEATIVQSLKHNDFAQSKVAATQKELEEERSAVADLL